MGRPRVGRPRGFDREAALGVATELFRRRGYEGVSIADLTAAIGVAPPSLYAAFGDKARLYREGLDRYAHGSAGLDLSILDRACDLHEGVGAMLAAAIGSVAESGLPCMISTGMLTCRPDHDALAEELRDRRRAFEHALGDKLTRWIAPDQATSLARYLVAVMQGLSVQARDGATTAELEGVAAHALSALPRS